MGGRGIEDEEMKYNIITPLIGQCIIVPDREMIYLQRKQTEGNAIFSNFRPPSWQEPRLSANYDSLTCLFWRYNDAKDRCVERGSRKSRGFWWCGRLYRSVDFGHLPSNRSDGHTFVRVWLD